MKYIDAEKLKKIVEQAKQRALKGIEVDEDMYCDGRADAFGEVLLEIASLQQKQLDCIWIHKKYNREYRIVSDNARLKNSNGEWIDCVIYAPLYENEFEMFAREKDSFYKEFEKK